MKKLLSIFLALVLIVPCCFIFAACGEEKPVLQTKNFKTVYYLNEGLNPKGSTLIYNFDERESEVNITEEMISGFYSSSIGTRTLKISYKGHEISLDYTILNIPAPNYRLIKQYTVNSAGEMSEVTDVKPGLSINLNFDRSGKFTYTEVDGEVETKQEGTFVAMGTKNLQATVATQNGGTKILNFEKTDVEALAYMINNENGIATYYLFCVQHS